MLRRGYIQFQVRDIPEKSKLIKSRNDVKLFQPLPILLRCSAQLISYNTAIIKDIYIEQKEVFDSVANFKINLELNVVKAGEYLLEVNNTKYIKQLIKGVQNINLDFNILKPKLWWPNGYGKQPLYDINVTLIKNKKIISDIIREAIYT